MSSRGALIKNGHVTTDEYHTEGMIEDAKILVGNKGKHGLPDFAHTKNRIYIKENSDHTFRELRQYGDNRFPIIEVAYHIERNLTGNGHEKVLHYHIFDENLSRTPAQKITDEIYDKFKMYLRRYGL